ncbi:MAG: hypothetical protein PVG71_03010 [Anaerolineae bacterium]|jgi:hypothetical protein
MDLTAKYYNVIFLVAPGVFVLAVLCMLGVTKGEAKKRWRAPYEAALARAARTNQG